MAKVSNNFDDFEPLNGVYAQLAKLIGMENAIKIHTAYKGQQINFPIKLYSHDYIVDERERKTANQLATETGYTDRHIRQIWRNADSQNPTRGNGFKSC